MQGDAKEEVRSRLNIEDVIGEYVQLKRAGRNFKGLSPFTSERTPSFMVSPDKQIWHDFSANRGGDVFSFVMEAEGMEFRQALEHLARKAGVDLSLYQTAGNRRITERKQRFLEMHQLATRYYQQSLIRNKTAVEYVFGARKLSKQIVTEFQIGYAPASGSALTNALKARGYTKAELAEAGLSSRYGNDLFRGRMMVPLMDPGGQVIGYTGRIIGEVEHAPKYLNTPQTLLYDKGRHVFGLSQAKSAIKTAGYVVIVEGNLDVISSHQVGVQQVVATAGTAITEAHVKALKRLSDDIRLCFDADRAGIAASERAISIASQVGVELSIVVLPGNVKDPDELIQQDRALWQAAVETTTPAMDWVLGHYARRYDVATAIGKRQFSTAALELVGRLSDPVERDHYLGVIANMTATSLQAVEQKFARLKSDAAPTKALKPVQAERSQPLDATYNYQDDLLALAASEPTAQELLKDLDINLLAGDNRQALARYMAANHGRVVDSVPESLQSYDEYVKMVLFRAEARYADLGERDRYFETARLIRHVEHEHKKQTRDTLVAKLRQAEADDDEVAATTLRNQLNTLIKEIARGQRR